MKSMNNRVAMFVGTLMCAVFVGTGWAFVQDGASIMDVLRVFLITFGVAGMVIGGLIWISKGEL